MSLRGRGGVAAWCRLVSCGTDRHQLRRQLRQEYRYSASTNDGRAVSYKNWQSGEEVQYTYDTLASLTLAETLGPDWGQSFSYDGWGNLLSKGVTKGSAPVMKRHGGPGHQSAGGLGDDV